MKVNFSYMIWNNELIFLTDTSPVLLSVGLK